MDDPTARRGNVTIGRLMLVVLVCRATLALLGNPGPVRGDDRIGWLRVMLAPSGTLLALAWICVVAGLARHRRARPFWLGYFIIGMIATGFAFVDFGRYDPIEFYILRVSSLLTPLLRPESWTPGG